MSQKKKYQISSFLSHPSSSTMRVCSAVVEQSTYYNKKSLLILTGASKKRDERAAREVPKRGGKSCIIFDGSLFRIFFEIVHNPKTQGGKARFSKENPKI